MSHSDNHVYSLLTGVARATKQSTHALQQRDMHAHDYAYSHPGLARFQALWVKFDQVNAARVTAIPFRLCYRR